MKQRLVKYQKLEGGEMSTRCSEAVTQMMEF